MHGSPVIMVIYLGVLKVVSLSILKHAKKKLKIQAEFMLL